MSRFATKYFGHIEWPDDALLVFPEGLPGFEHERRFARLEPARYAPLIFLQSASTPELCFLAAPVAAVDPGYKLDVHAEELQRICAAARDVDVLDVGVMVLLTVREGSPATANLLAPVVVDGKSRLAVQAIRRDRLYSCRHPLAGTPLAGTPGGERLAQCL